jgi:hypothetical protein
METLTIASNKKIQSLTNEDLLQFVPSAFAEKPSSKTSERYSYINTMDIVDKLRSIGLVASEAHQVRYRDLANQSLGFQKHSISFIHPEMTVINKKNQIEEMFEVRLVNSHNGSSKFSLFASFLRLACDNGMLCTSGDMGELITRHTGQGLSFDSDKAINTLKDQFGNMVKFSNKMKSKMLSNDNKIELATSMAKVRFAKQKDDFKFKAEELLTPIREADKGNSLWKVYNVVQEKLIKGFDPSDSRKIRPVNHFDLQLNLNKELFESCKIFMN